MVRGGIKGGKYHLLSKKEIEEIHHTSLKILQQTGIKSKNNQILALFSKIGAEVNFEQGRIKFSPALVEDTINKAPSKVILCGREEKNDLILEDERVYCGTGGAALNVLDLETGEKRGAVLKDIADIAKLVDALDNIHFFIRPVVARDVPREFLDVNKYYAALSNTSKHVMGSAYSVESALKVISMAEEIAGGEKKLRERPLISFITCWMKSPLQLDDSTTLILMKIAEEKIPVALSSDPMAGSTSPVTLAGTLAQVNAEQLSGMVLTQSINPGAPVIYGAIPTVADMHSMAFLGGAIELGILDAGCAQLAHYYNLPFYAWGGLTDSKIPDIQAGYEKGTTLLLVALAGANYIHNSAGMLESTTTVAYEQYVIDNEIIGMVMRALRGIEVNEDTLALDLIDKVGPGGNFLAEEHTVSHMRSEFFFPRVSDRSQREKWLSEGGKDARERAREIAKDILAEHKPLPLPSDVDKKIKSSVRGLIEFGG
ncbi:MAG: trimethylamine methyltransferase family protein [Candidatus Aerophobetes bacterium]|nr:trimethylamine methyltransferase family protein [Candidatus Aerophobetes bacterium]